MASGTYERRRTLALKWNYIDGLEPREIRQRFIDEGFGELTPKTISKYLNSESAQEVHDRLYEDQAQIRLQVAEREERKHRRAREAERNARADQPVIGFKPKIARNNRADDPILVPDWTVLDPDDEQYPDWANPALDTIVEKADGMRHINPREAYVIFDILGEPEYREAIVGVDRDVPDEKTRSNLRYEQSKHLTAKGEAMQIYTDDEDEDEASRVEIMLSADRSDDVEIAATADRSVQEADSASASDADDTENEEADS